MKLSQLRAIQLEILRRLEIKKTLVAELHEAQRKVYEDPSQYRAVCASRRGGKTHLDATLITISLLESGRDVWTLFIAPTGVIAKELIWDQLVEMNERFTLGWKMSEHPTPYIVTPSGAKFRVLGCDDKAQLAKVRGKKYKLVIIDEAKDITQHLRQLVDEDIGPAFMGVGGKMIVSGTPGRTCSEKDYWYAINNGRKVGWTAHYWTLHQNPWIKDPTEELRKVREQKGWTEDNVIYQREYLGLWVSDESERVYSYLMGRNSEPGLPKDYDKDVWVHIMGVDLGYNPDPTAWVVLASHPKRKDVYVVHAETKLNQLPDEVAARTKELILRFKPSRVVGDSGGAGKSYVEEWNRRWAASVGTWIQAADKRGKRDHQEIMSEELRAGRIKVCLSEAGDLAHEWTNLGWENELRERENKSQPNHLADAALYSYMEHRAYYHLDDPPPPSEEEIRLKELRARQAKVRAAQNQGLLR